MIEWRRNCPNSVLIDEIDRRLAKVDKPIETFDRRLGELDERPGSITSRLAKLDDQILSVRLDVADLKGRVTQMPSTMQMLWLVLAVISIVALSWRFLH